jgi:Protein of unknown function (DUF2865)
VSVRYLRFFGIIAAISSALALSGAPAGAQGGGFFNSWFGGGQRQDTQRQDTQRQDTQRQDSWFGRRPPQPIPPQTNAYSDPSNPSDRQVYTPFGQAPPAASGTGRSVAYCVRTCDGRYFPMQRHANANPVQLCGAFCPAAKTVVFNGSQIDQAVAANGARYADLDNAFVYRQKIVEGCTCNGKDAFGVARIDLANDPTLRPGDIVASGDNVKAALIAMAAAKERQPAVPEIANEKPVSRPGAIRRVAGPTTAVPADPTTEVAPGDQADPIPED